MTPEEADAAQQWANLDGATAFHLIERHADNWQEIGAMMEAWLRARSRPDALDRMALNAAELDTDY